MIIFTRLKNFIWRSLRIKSIQENVTEAKSFFRFLFVVQPKTHEETFEQALERLKLTQEDIDHRERELSVLVKLFLIIAVCVLVYIIYSLFQKSLIASLGGFGILLIVIAQLFRYHFWLFQIRKKQLGCSFKAWINNLIQPTKSVNIVQK